MSLLLGVCVPRISRTLWPIISE